MKTKLREKGIFMKEKEQIMYNFDHENVKIKHIYMIKKKAECLMTGQFSLLVKIIFCTKMLVSGLSI